MILYKVLRQDGTPRYQSRKTGFWPMPKDGEPGDWVDVGSGQALRLCAWGLHGYRTMAQAQADCRDGQLVYTMEVDESKPFIDDNYGEGANKVCCQRARILAAVADKSGELVFLADYVWQ